MAAEGKVRRSVQLVALGRGTGRVRWHWVVTILRNVLPNLARASSSIPLLLFSQLQLCTGSLEPLTLLFCIQTLVQFQLVVQDEKDFTIILMF